MTKNTPQITTIELSYTGKQFDIEYFFRGGNIETILFVHGVGGAKENYWEACKSCTLANHDLYCFDNPGTGNSTYYNDFSLSMLMT